MGRRGDAAIAFAEAEWLTGAGASTDRNSPTAIGTSSGTSAAARPSGSATAKETVTVALDRRASRTAG